MDDLFNEEANKSRRSSVASSVNGDAEEQGTQNVGMMKIMSFYNPKWLAYFAYIVSIINGCVFPVNGLIFSKVVFIIQNPESPNYDRDRHFWCGMFLVLTVGVLIVGFLNKYIYSYLGENLTYTVRGKLFTGIIFKHLGWFDNKERAPGILSNVLSEDIT